MDKHERRNTAGFKKRWISLLVAFTMVLGLMPTFAFAGDTVPRVNDGKFYCAQEDDKVCFVLATDSPEDKIPSIIPTMLNFETKEELPKKVKVFAVEESGFTTGGAQDASIIWSLADENNGIVEISDPDDDGVQTIETSKEGTAVVIGTIEDSEGGVHTTEIEFTVTSITISSEVNRLKVGEKVEITATVGSSTEVEAPEVTVVWEVSDESIATIDSVDDSTDGIKAILTGVSDGNVTVTATIEEGTNIEVELDFVVYSVPDTYEVTIKVVDEDRKPVEGAQVNLTTYKGLTDANGVVNFKGIESGFYFVVVEKDGKETAEFIKVDYADLETTITLLNEGKTVDKSVIDDTPITGVIGLSDVIINSNLKNILTEEELADVNAGKSLSIGFKAETKTEDEVREDFDKIKDIARKGENLAPILDLSVNKKIDGNEKGTIKDLGELIRISLDINNIGIEEDAIPFTIINLYRVHDGKAEKINRDFENANADGEFFEIVGIEMTSYLQKFSTYVIGTERGYFATVDYNNDNEDVTSNIYPEGESVTINAGKKDGYTFKEWTVTIGGSESEYTFNPAIDLTTPELTFPMPAENIKLTANWVKNEDPSVTTYTVTMKDAVTGATVSTKKYAEGATVTIDAGTKGDGYTFNYWTSSDVTVASTNSSKTTFVMPAKDVTVTSHWYRSASTGGGGGGSSTVANYTVKSTVGTGGKISIATSLTVTSGDNLTFTVTPDEGYVIADVIINDVSVGAVSTYTISNIIKNQTIDVTFKAADETETKPDTEEPSTTEAPVFADVNSSDWFYNSVMQAVERGIFAGTSDTTFSPSVATNRAMIAALLYRMSGEPALAEGATTNFADVTTGQYYYNAVIWAQTAGIVSGYSDTVFAPNDNITREQMASILYRYAQMNSYDMSGIMNSNLKAFGDESQISDYAVTAMQWANGSGLINGKGDGILDPKGSATRAEVATILVKFQDTFMK